MTTNLDNIKSEIDVAVVWRQKTYAGGGATSTSLRFGLKRSFFKTSGSWEAGNTVALDPVALGRQYYSNLTSISPIRQGFAAGLSPKMQKTTTTLTISKTSGHEYIGKPSFEWSDLEQMQRDITESQSFTSIIAIFVFEKGQEIDPDADLFFTGVVDVDSFDFKNGALDLTITDQMWQYNKPLLQYVVATSGEKFTAAPGVDFIYNQVPYPIILGEFSKVTRVTGDKYRFVKLLKGEMGNPFGAGAEGTLLVCDPGSGDAIIDDGAFYDNWVYHYQGGEMKSIHPTQLHTDNSTGEITVRLDTTIWGKDYPIGGGTPFDLQSWGETHNYFMIMHYCTGSAEGPIAPAVPKAVGDVWLEILVSYMGISTNMIGDSFSLINSRMPLILVRNINYEQVDRFDYLSSLNEATGTATIFVNGKFEIVQLPIWGDRIVDVTIYPKDIVSVDGKSSLKITTDPGRSKLSKGQTLSIKYDSDMGFTPTDQEQDGVRTLPPTGYTQGDPPFWFFPSSGVQPNPPGYVNSAPGIDDKYFSEYPSAIAPPTPVFASDEILNNDWIYTEDAAAQLHELIVAYRQDGANGNLRGGEVAINKRIIGDDVTVGSIIRIKDANIGGDTVIDALVYSAAPDLNKMTTKLLFEAVDIA